MSKEGVGNLPLFHWLSDWLGRVLGVSRDEITQERSLFDLGLSSRDAMALATELAMHLGRPVPVTLFWEHPTIAALLAQLGDPAVRPRAEDLAAAPTTPALQARRAAYEPMAIVGMSCRFPRSPGLAEFWSLLKNGVDAVEPVPTERWDAARYYDSDRAAPGKAVTQCAALLDDVRGFEPLFFGISPREADELDPQQRLALELTWEALEDAGIPPLSLAGSATGVYFGSMWHDFADLTQDSLESMSGHRATGISNNLIANRVSHFLGLRGPSLVLDTACSSALVAIHLGSQALMCGDAELVIAGAFNLLLSPASMVFCSKFGGLSPDGRCKAFDAAADGFGRGEGGGVVVLKPLARALAAGDRIHCVLRGSAVNSGGGGASLLAPNPRAQEAVLRAALSRAELAPGRVAYVEAHGTGTLLGDPIEAAALGAVYGPGRSEAAPLHIGSVKTNIGHTEGAAGIASLIKTALAMRHRALPPSLHLRDPSTHIPFSALRLAVPRELQPWPAPLDEPALAGVSAFGWGGTNAHVVLEAEPPEPRLFCLSAASAAGLRTQLGELRQKSREVSFDELRLPEPQPGVFRAALVARSLHELAAQLDAALAGGSCEGLYQHESGEPPARVVFVLSPLGSQWPGMARKLLHSEPVFRAEVERCERALLPLLGRSIVSDLLGDWQVQDAVMRVQPLLFAVQVGLAALLRSWGIHPAAVIGHSAGEIAAAYIAGALRLEQAARVVHHYAQAQRLHAGQGAMALLSLPVTAAEHALAACDGRVVIAAENSPDSTVISGPRREVAEILSALQLHRVSCAQIHTDVAGHSPLVAPGLAELAAALSDLRPEPPSLPFFSTVTGGLFAGAVDGAYFAQNLGQRVLFRQALSAVLQQGPALLVELGPHPVLAHAVNQNLLSPAQPPTSCVFPTLRRSADERLSLLQTRAALFVRGAAAPEPHQAPDAPPRLLVLSARTRAALEQARERGAAHLRTHAAPLHDVCYTAALRRSHLPHRLAVVGRSQQELVAALAQAEPGPALPQAPAVVFVFAGQGSQWLGMGRKLMASWPLFLAELQACDEALAPHWGSSVIAELRADADRSQLHRSDVAQPVLWAIQVALAALFRSLGIAPAAVIGHSMGEVAAAFVAGHLDRASAARLIATRSRLARTLSARSGGMAMVELSAAEAEHLVRPFAAELAVGVHNGPRECVISGESTALAGVLAELSSRGVFHRQVRVDYASHSPLMQPLREPLQAALAGLVPSPGPNGIPMISTLTARRVRPPELGPAYWADNLCERVRFADAVASLLRPAADGPDGLSDPLRGRSAVFLELGPHPVLLSALRDTLEGHEGGHRALGSLRKDEDEASGLLHTLGALYAAGAMPDFAQLFPAGGRVTTLPATPWQRTSHWFAATPTAAKKARTDFALLGRPFRSPAQPGRFFFETSLSLQRLPFLRDHRVGESIVVPAALFLSLALAAAPRCELPGHTAIADAVFHDALVLSEGAEVEFQLVLTAAAPHEAHAEATFSCYSRDGESWRLHASGRLRVAAATELPALPEITELEASEPPGQSMPADEFYASLRERGLHYGPSFAGVQKISTGNDRVWGAIHFPSSVTLDGEQLRIALLDAALHLGLALLSAEQPGRALVPVSLRRLAYHAEPAEVARALARLCSVTAENVELEVTLLDGAGRVIGIASGLILKWLEPRRVPRELLLTESWIELPAVAQSPRQSALRWLLVPDRGGIGARLQTRLQARGEEVQLFHPDAPLPTGTFSGLLCFSALDIHIAEDQRADQVLADVLDGAVSALHAAQALLQKSQRDLPRLWLFTRGVQELPGVSKEPRPPEVGQAPLWGLGLTLSYEHPELRCACVDLSSAPLDEELDALTEELHAPSQETALALRGSRRFGARLSQGSLEMGPAPDFSGTHLISGGLGDLGLALAQWLVEKGAQGLVLLSRGGVTTEAQAQAIERLRAANVRVRAAAIDVSQHAELAAFLSTLEEPLHGVFHAAGLLADSTVERQDRGSFARVLSPKVAGAWNLHQLTRAQPLRFFVLYSSMAALLGSPGQSNYAAANRFLDALAAYRRASGRPGLSVNWGAFAEIGLAAREAQRGERLSARGLSPLPVARAYEELERLLSARDPGRMGVARLASRKWLEFHLAVAGTPLFSELRGRAEASAAPSLLRAKLAQSPAKERLRLIESFVQDEAQRVLRIDAARVHRQANLVELGLDSLLSQELRNRLEAGLGLKLRATVAFSYPQLGELSAHLAALLAELHPETPPESPAPEKLSDDELLAELTSLLEQAP